MPRTTKKYSNQRKTNMTIFNEVDVLNGSLNISNTLFSFANSMALKCAVELRIADIINSHGHPTTLSQIASAIDSPTVNTSYLNRIMRMLVRMKIFTATNQSDGGEILYAMTPSSMAILHDSEISLAPFLLMENHPLMLSTWHYLSDCVKEGGSGFKKAHGRELFEMASTDPELNKIFNDAMRCSGKFYGKAIASSYRDGLSGVETLVDVGGGGGHLIGEIVKEFPHIKGINFDLPHVIATAPVVDGVSHVAGDMFKSIPTADAVLMKGILHDWGDDDCIKILKICRKALTNKIQKVIIIDMVLGEGGESKGPTGNLDVMLDLAMMAHCIDGKERTELEWKKILEEAGFGLINIIDIPAFSSVIEAYPARIQM